MKTTRQNTKMKIAAALLTMLISGNLFAQSWSITGNAGIAAGTNYLGTSDPNDLVFRSNAIERGRLLGTGEWRFGGTTNYVSIDGTGRLRFNGNGVYQVGSNRYAFQLSADPNYGLFFNTTLGQYEFRDGTASSVFAVAGTGNAVLKGTLKVGAYTFPATDGAANQVLKTNGAGALAWSADNNTTYSAGTGISLVGTTFSNAAPDQTVTLTGSNGITTGGAYPNLIVSGSGLWRTIGNAGTTTASNFIGTTDAVGFAIRTNNIERIRIGQDGRVGVGTISPTAWLHVNAALNEDALRVQTNGTTRLFIDNTGGVSIGSLTPGPAGGLFINGNLGAGIATPTDRVHISGDATGITFDGGQYIRDVTGAGFSDIEIHANFVPDNTNSHSLGSSTSEWIDVWAIDGTINLTSKNTTKNVKNMPYGINEIMKLRPVTYNRVTNPEGGDGTTRLGLIAEELKAVVPEAVKDWAYAEDEQTKKVTKVAIAQPGISLENMIPVLIKAIQEQQLQINELKKLNGISASGQAPPSVSEENAINVKLSNQALDQNIPNPLSNNTSIRYNIPSSANNASLIITDNSGKTIRQITLKPGAGTINVDAAALNSGTYSYTLIIDGRTIDTKKMVIAR